MASLTAAVRLNHPQHGAVDFSDVLASALGAVAGNVGSGERITAGRPGSWESDLVAQLVTGTVGDDGAALATYRTEPVVVRLNVAQLVIEAREDAREQERDGMLVDLTDAIDALPDPWGDGREPTDEEESGWAAAEAHLRRRYTEAYEAYAQRFAAAVAAMYVAVMAAGVWSFWGDPRQVASWLLMPPLLLALSPLVSIGLVVLTSESWFYAPQPGKRAMLMMWPTRPPKGWNAGNFAAEPRHEGLGGALAHAWLDDLDRRGRVIYITAADDELVKTYKRWGFTDRNAKRGMVRRPGTSEPR